MRVDGARALAAFRRFLTDRNLPATQQRLAVATVVLDAADHLSADDVLRRVARRGTDVGLATVYRTLDLLVSSGLVAERDFGEGFRRYEPVAPGQAHEHCICSACGRVMEL
ncbi:MAG TPA: transcriptional repressor, partial [Gemmatimonadales bacterium]|nr:transcriptional repressor [Gemmatimonadales bacterium]